MNKLIKLVMTAVLAVALVVPVAVQAKRVEPERAERLAQRFAEKKHGPRGKVDVRLRHSGKRHGQRPGGGPGRPQGMAPQSHSAQDTAVYYYVFNVNEGDTTGNAGFVIVSADDVAKPVLGYSVNGSYDENNLPPGFVYWMEYLSDQIAWAQENGVEQSAEIRQEWDDYMSGEITAHVAASVAPLVQTRWGQGERTKPSYNSLLPDDGGGRSLTGCVATAMAQIMKYHNHPKQGTGQSEAYTTRTNRFDINSVDFASFGAYDWDNMLDEYAIIGRTCVSSFLGICLDYRDVYNFNADQLVAVAELMLFVGISVKMDWTSNGSGAYDAAVAPALINHFGYDRGTKLVRRSSYTDVGWENMLRAQIDAGMPVYYSGALPSEDRGHAFICDGYYGEDMFHFNWGWGGSPNSTPNGYFRTTALNTNNGSFNRAQAAVINITPDRGGRSVALPTVRYPIFTEEFRRVGSSFTIANGTQPNRWHIGTAASVGNRDSDTLSAYISNSNGASNTYSKTQPSIVHMYRNVELPASAVPCTLKFNWMGAGENHFDDLNVRLVETTVTPTAGITPVGTSLGTFRGSNSWQTASVVIPASNNGTTKRLVFTWRNDGFVGTQPAIAVDNIMVGAPELTVTYNINGGAGTTPTARTIGAGNSVILPNGSGFSRTGYSFGGWNTIANGTGTNHNASSSYTPTNNVILYARWDSIYTIAYNLDGGNVTTANPMDYTVRTPAFTLNNPTKTNYVFSGWTGTNGTTPQTSVTIATGSVGNRNYTANWTPANYTITYNLNGGIITGSANPTSYTIETDNFTLNNPTRTGYTFLGWTGTNGTVPETTVTIAQGSTGSRNYTAQWAVDNYTVTYNGNGNTDGTAPIVQTSAYNTMVTVAEVGTLVKTGHTFAGWNTAADGSGIAYAVGVTYTIPASNTDLYAQWTPIPVTDISDIPSTIIVETQVPLSGVVIPSNAANQNIIWSIASAGNTGSGIFIGNVLFAHATGTVIVRATIAGGNADGADFVKDFFITVSATTAITSDDRNIPQSKPDVGAAVIPPVNVSAFEVSVGPNPVCKSGNGVNIFITGKRIASGTLTVYDASGNVVGKVKVKDNHPAPLGHPAMAGNNVNGNVNGGRRIIGNWDLKDAKGKIVSKGTYLLRGTVKTIDGNRERVSVVVGVR